MSGLATGQGNSWVRALPADLPALEAFLRSREAEAAGFISRLRREGRLRLPGLGGGLLLVAKAGEAVSGALLKTHTGIAFPLLPRSSRGPFSPLIPGKLLDDFACLASVVGPGPDVESFESFLGLKPLVVVPYELMRLPLAANVRSLAGPRREGIPSPGFAIAKAGPSDLDELYPLQDAYEHEEVLTAIHRFDARGCRIGLEKALRDQLVMVGRLDGAAVAKAATNAQAFTMDQIGGVFVAPPYRRKGYGEAVVLALLERLAEAGKGAVLFVKLGNEAARGLYEGLGFEALGPFRADYFVG